MTTKQVTKLAADHGFDFWYDSRLKLWTLVDIEDRLACQYFTKMLLTKIDEQIFVNLYLTRV